MNVDTELLPEGRGSTEAVEDSRPVLHPLLDTLFQALEHAGIRWCLLRVPASLVAPEGDIDVLVDVADLPTARHVLRRLHFVEIPGQGHGVHCATYHRATDQWLWIHIVSGLSFGPFYTLATGAAAGCLERRQHTGAVALLAPDDAFWALLLHCMLDKGHVAERHRPRLQELALVARPDGPLGRIMGQVCPAGWTAERMLAAAGACDWPELEAVSPALIASWMEQRGVTRRTLFIRHQQRRLRRWWYLWPRRGVSVALLGPDGAGKSTLVQGIQDSFVFPVVAVYMGLTGGHLPMADRLRVPPLVIAARLFVFWCRYLIAQYHRLHGRLVVYDRYIYDSMVPTPHELTPLGRLYRRIDGRSLPPPDLVLLLDAPGEIMHRRKGEYTPEQLESWRQHFLAIRQHRPNVEVLDTTQPRDDVRTAALERIWQRYAARWG